MDYTLDSLSALEIELYYSLPDDKHFDELNEELEANGTFAKNRKIHEDYLELFNSVSDSAIKYEALKRIIFLNWYSLIEPDYFTGISNLNEKVIYKSYSIINDYIKNEKLDEELNWMMKFYSSWDWAILNFSENRLPYLTKFVKAVDTSISSYPKQKLPQGTMRNRGQMGLYWISMQVEV
ncbi:MAG: hypothetical protein WC622_16165 [Pedobacter sp.]|jgi:hypothetical protein|uniref:hypothetical protein n=1 Tax=Pedobacter sp. TaxID=1411316 RepID=UPI00356B5645